MGSSDSGGARPEQDHFKDDERASRDSLYRVRWVLLKGEETLDAAAAERLIPLLELGDPNREVAIAYRVKERLRDSYWSDDPMEARRILKELPPDCVKKAMPPGMQKSGRTMRTWFDKLCNYHLARVTNGPTEALNNLIKRIKRIAFEFTNFENCESLPVVRAVVGSPT